MKDFIFITGASGIGKSTLAKGLLEYYKTTCIEQWMIPEFHSRDGKEEMTGELEALAEVLYPTLKAYYDTPEGQAEF